MCPMKVQDFNWTEDAVLNLLYLHWDVKNNPDKYEEWVNYTERHSFHDVVELVKTIPDRTKKFAILYSLHERSFLKEKKHDDDNIALYDDAIAALSDIVNRPGYTHNDVRFCDVCGMPMCEGLFLDPYETDGGYYCCEEHAKQDMTTREFKQFSADGTLFYTTWYGSGDSEEVEL